MINDKVKAILDWAANEKLCNLSAGYVEEFYSDLIRVLSKEFSINRDELITYFNQRFDKIEDDWASEEDY